MANFDPYLQWLGIRSPERPPNHYRLLGVEPFESDASVIETAADRQMAHVRTFQNGKDADLSQQILNELAAAKLCLLDGKSKFEYDTRLKERYFNDPPPVDPATIDIAPTGSRVSDLADDPEIDIAVDDDSFQLSRPKRGVRGPKKTWLLGCGIVMLLLGGVAYQFGPVSTWFSDEQVTDASDPDGSTPAGERPASDNDLNTDIEPPASAPPDDPEISDPANVGDSSEETSSTDDVPSDPPDRPTLTADERVAVVEPRTPRRDPARDSSSDAAPWNLPVDRTPFKYKTDNPLESFALAIANRDLETSQIILDSHADGTSLGRGFAGKLQPLVLSHEQFWQSVGEAIDELRMATEIQYRGVTVQVVGRKQDSVQLKAGNGERKSLSTLQVRCDPDLAVALVLYRHRANPHVAWRMIGTFLSVDKFGDIELAQQYWRDAERNGIVVAPDRRAFDFLSQVAGANVQTLAAETSNSESDSAEDANVVDDHVLSASAEPRRPVPGRNALREARRRATKDLESFFKNKTEQGKEILVEELLERATETQLNPISAFALLDLAKQVGTELERGDFVLRSLVQMARNYDLDLQKAVSTELSSFEKSGATQEIVGSAVQLGDEMIRAGEFRLADQLLATAESRLNAAPELTADVTQFRVRLTQSKEINRAGILALQTLSQDHKDTDANHAAGLHYLVRHQFKEGLTHLLLSGHADLRNLAMTDLMAAKTSRPNGTLAAQWEVLADEFEGVVKASMLARAKYWSGR